MFLALAALGLASCNNGFKEGPGGMLYKIVDDKSGASVQVGDFIAFDYTAKTDADSLLGSSYEQGHPLAQIITKPRFKGDVMAGISYMSEGDSAVIKTNIDSLGQGKPRPPQLKGKYIVYTIKIEKVIPKGHLSEQVFMGRCNAYMQSLNDKMKNEEPAAIKKFIAGSGLKVATTASGLDYVITQQGQGPKPVDGDTVVVNYVGKFLNGKVFDTNIKPVAIKAKLVISPMNPYKPVHFPLGSNGMIKGWVEGMELMNKGSKATFILPSDLAYGEHGYGPIAPYTPLVFDVELLDIIKPNPNAPKPTIPAMPEPAKKAATVKK